MSLFGVLITYACCWWLVLFMVLPWRVRVPERPAVGVAASAPINPMLKRKIFITTLLAILPTMLFYVLVSDARASGIYHAGGGCPPKSVYQSSGDVDARDGVGAGGRKVAPATLGNNSVAVPGDVYVGIELPASDYSSNSWLKDSPVYAGVVRVQPDGKVDYNGQPISEQPLYDNDCK